MKRLFSSLLALALLALVGCTTITDLDYDGDGYDDDVDCAPQDPRIFPGADDPFGDGIDQNCDGVDGVDSGVGDDDDSTGDDDDDSTSGDDDDAAGDDDDDSTSGNDDDAAGGDDDDSTGDDDDSTGNDDDSTGDDDSAGDDDDSGEDDAELPVLPGDFIAESSSGCSAAPLYSCTSVMNVVSGGPVSITDLNVQIDITSPQAPLVSLALEGPDGTSIDLTMKPGTLCGTPWDDYTATVFDDEAPLTIEDGCPPFSGYYQPVSNLSSFDGKSSTGDWTILLTYGAEVGVGDATLTSWALGFEG